MKNKINFSSARILILLFVIGLFASAMIYPVFAEGITVLSRVFWGANEELRVYDKDNPEALLAKLPENFYVRYAQELKLKKIVEKNEKGQLLTWPQQYLEKVTKIIVHHSATTKDLDNPTKAISDIYRFHTISRGWGDIGYNYIIDLEGNVYEGRAGEEGVVGAHAGPGNRGSVGIAVLGNYNDEKLTAQSLETLKRLLSELTRIHGINPVGTSYFRGTKQPNIMGHRNIMGTSCPGEQLMAILPKIRTDVALMNGNYNYNKEYDQLRKMDYAFEYLPTIEEIYMPPDRRMEYTIKLKNIGLKPWNSETYLRAKPDRFTQDSFFVSHAKLLENRVNPGEVGTFKIKIQSKLIPGFFYLNFKTLYDGLSETEQLLSVPTIVEKPVFAYEYVSTHLPKTALNTGEQVSALVGLRNTGNVSWRNYGENRISLGTDNAHDRVSPFTKSTRMGYLTNSEVKPGEVGQFLFTLTAPKYPGLYEEFFAPVIERITWLDGNGMKFIFNVTESTI